MLQRCKVFIASQKLDDVIERLERIEKLLLKKKKHKPPGPKYMERSK